MLQIVTDEDSPDEILDLLKKYGLKSYDVKRLDEYKKNPSAEENHILLYYGSVQFQQKNYQLLFQGHADKPILWFPKRVLLSKEEWIRSYELGLSFIPGTLMNPEVLLARLSRLLDTYFDPDDDRTEENTFLTLVHNYLEAHYLDKDFSIEKMGLDLGMSRTNFYSKIKSASGLTPSKLVMRFKLHKAESLLKQRAGNIAQVAYLAGFSSTSYFTKCFKEFFGTRPSDLILAFDLAKKY